VVFSISQCHLIDLLIRGNTNMIFMRLLISGRWILGAGQAIRFISTWSHPHFLRCFHRPAPELPHQLPFLAIFMMNLAIACRYEIERRECTNHHQLHPIAISRSKGECHSSHKFFDNAIVPYVPTFAIY
jgi:hypothetical protein